MSILVAVVVLLAALSILSALQGCTSFSAPNYQGPRSSHFDGEEFLNVFERKAASGSQVKLEVQTGETKGFIDFINWVKEREKGPWKEWVDADPGPPPPKRVGPGELRITFVNHSTFLIQMDGINILTDPIWSERCSPVSFAGPRRHRPPGIRFEDLPPIDVVVISHNHYDHLDVPTLKALYERHQPHFVVPLGNSILLRQNGIQTSGDLDWWQSVYVAKPANLIVQRADTRDSKAERTDLEQVGSQVGSKEMELGDKNLAERGAPHSTQRPSKRPQTRPVASGHLASFVDREEGRFPHPVTSRRSGVRVTAVPAQHFSGRGLFDRNETLWAGFVLQSTSFRLYFAGDTGYGPHFDEIGKRLGPFDVALLPIGAYKPEWFMSAVHISPKEALQAMIDTNSRTMIPMHYGTFALADDGQHESLDDLRRALEERSDVDHSDVAVVGEGKSFDVVGESSKTESVTVGVTREHPLQNVPKPHLE